jgi:hypothetical protein
MAVTTISFNGFSLQSTTYLTGNILYRLLPSKQIDNMLDYRRGGFNVVDTYYTQKSITVTGWIVGGSVAALRTAIDAMKAALYPQEQLLVINDGSGAVQYTATLQSLDITEDYYTITQVPFSAVFMALPWCTDTTPGTDTQTLTSTPYTGSINVGGSFGPFPVIRWTVNGTPGGGITAITFTNTTTGDWITIPLLTLTSNAHYLELDLNLMTVIQDGTTAKDFTGVFPSFMPGVNAYTVAITGSGFNVTQLITYYPTYL